MAYKVELHPEAEEDLAALDKSIRKQAAKKIDSLAENPLSGKRLGNNPGVDLTGFYKLYVAKKKYRIVYRLIGDCLEIIETIAIGKRDKEEIYKIAAKRLGKLLKKGRSETLL